jgi:NADPH:quinone reductase
MQAVRFQKPGPPDVLENVSLPMPVIADDEVLVRAHSIGVGVPDTLIRSGKYQWAPKLPTIPGIEMSGTVEQTGADIDDLEVGQKVIVSARERSERGGCYAEYIAVKRNELFILPDSADLEAAGALANYQVAWHLLHSGARIQQRDTILVFAAAGGVGSAAIELAAQAGLTVIGVASGKAKCAFIEEYGAHHLIDRSTEQVMTRLHEITAGRGADIVLDPIGGPDFAEKLSLLAPMGLLVSYGGLAGSPSGDLLSAMNARFGNSPAVRRFSMHSFDDQPAERARAMHSLISMLAQNSIRPRIYARLLLSSAAEAHRLLESGTTIGKIILQP